ncbi:MAG: UDP-N-acetyl glucosamine 2-epimerase [Candidatus Acetothermia bacterium]|jgi:UDP-N-acetylglucosamine 2-epimerase|nr:UDP-N-acetyl glucosamine 2-epimerase [Candidatus Acetothermia bacterium]
MKIIDVVGCRPQFIKAAPILRAIAHYNEERCDQLVEVLLHTGQHYDYELSQVFFDELGLKAPDYHLGVGSGTHGCQTGEMLKRVEEVLLKEKPGLVMVYGDTNTALAGALAAAKLHIPVAHVEAGLRSFNRRMPEEINRLLTDHVSSLLFCPTKTAVENLRREGFTNILNAGHLLPLDDAPQTMGPRTTHNGPRTAHYAPRTTHHGPVVANTGDVMYDAVLLYGELAERKSRILGELGLEPKGYALATVHRSENTDQPERLRAIFEGLEQIAREVLPVILPVHPRTRKQLDAIGLRPMDVQVLDPVSYLDMLILEKNARVILTDSGGVQKEAFFFRVPCVTLREETEWVETVEAGWNTLVGSDPGRIVQAALEARPGVELGWPYGDGHAAERAVLCVLFSLGEDAHLS